MLYVQSLMNTYTRVMYPSPARQAATTGLAVVGFIALVALGIWLAIYSARFVPTIANRFGSAAVYLGSVFHKDAPSSSLVVVPTASTTIPFGDVEGTTTPSTTATTTEGAPITKRSSHIVKTTAGEKTATTTQIGGTSAPSLSGLPDLTVQITSIGYLTTTSGDSFVASTTVPKGNRPAIKFTVKNIGSNVMSSWRFTASIPTQTAYLYQSQMQQALNPGDSIDYTLGFDQATAGSNKSISIVVNPDHAVAESNTGNNTATAVVTILGN